MTGKVASTGISLYEPEMEQIRILMRGDRRSLSWLVREAVQMYLQTRQATQRKRSGRTRTRPANAAFGK